MTRVLVKRLTPTAKMPVYGSAFSAGMDLSADLGLGETLTLYPGLRYTISTGLAFSIPNNTYMRIAPRSGLAAKHGFDVLAGVVDCDYRGEVKVVLLHTGQSQVTIHHGDRIAQGILEMIARGDIVEELEALPGTERGEGGFGSTGVA